MTLATILVTGDEPEICRVASTSTRVPGRIPDAADIYASMRLKCSLFNIKRLFSGRQCCATLFGWRVA
jgi:hypothetical protein